MTNLQSDMPNYKIYTVEEVKTIFAQTNKTIFTFAGFSGQGYQDLNQVERIVVDHMLANLDPQTVIINIGITADGIGAAYEWATRAGFETSGIVSSKALEYGDPVSPHLNKQAAYFIQDDVWGGYLENSQTLSPTSEAMVSVSDKMVAIGGGGVTLDEMCEMAKRNKEVVYVPAEMNHQKAEEKARKNGEPLPRHFFGPLHARFPHTLL